MVPSGRRSLRLPGLVLKQYGLGGTTIEAIAKEAGVDRATIYYYFADKGAIFGEVMHGGLAEMVAALEEVAASEDSPEVQLRGSIRVVMRAFEQHYPQLYVFFTEDSSSVIDGELHTEIIAAGRRYEDLLDVVVRDGIRQGIFQTSLPPKAFTKMVAGMLNWTSRWFAAAVCKCRQQDEVPRSADSNQVLNHPLIRSSTPVLTTVAG